MGAPESFLAYCKKWTPGRFYAGEVNIVGQEGRPDLYATATIVPSKTVGSMIVKECKELFETAFQKDEYQDHCLVAFFGVLDYREGRMYDSWIWLAHAHRSGKGPWYHCVVQLPQQFPFNHELYMLLREDEDLSDEQGPPNDARRKLLNELPSERTGDMLRRRYTADKELLQILLWRRPSEDEIAKFRKKYPDDVELRELLDKYPSDDEIRKVWPAILRSRRNSGKVTSVSPDDEFTSLFHRNCRRVIKAIKGTQPKILINQGIKHEKITDDLRDKIHSLVQSVGLSRHDFLVDKVIKPPLNQKPSRTHLHGLAKGCRGVDLVMYKDQHMKSAAHQKAKTLEQREKFVRHFPSPEEREGLGKDFHLSPEQREELSKDIHLSPEQHKKLAKKGYPTPEELEKLIDNSDTHLTKRRQGPERHELHGIANTCRGVDLILHDASHVKRTNLQTRPHGSAHQLEFGKDGYRDDDTIAALGFLKKYPNFDFQKGKLHFNCRSDHDADHGEWQPGQEVRLGSRLLRWKPGNLVAQVMKIITETHSAQNPNFDVTERNSSFYASVGYYFPVKPSYACVYLFYHQGAAKDTYHAYRASVAMLQLPDDYDAIDNWIASTPPRTAKGGIPIDWVQSLEEKVISCFTGSDLVAAKANGSLKLKDIKFINDQGKVAAFRQQLIKPPAPRKDGTPSQNQSAHAGTGPSEHGPSRGQAPATSTPRTQNTLPTSSAHRRRHSSSEPSAPGGASHSSTNTSASPRTKKPVVLVHHQASDHQHKKRDGDET